MDAQGGRWRKVFVRLFQVLLSVVLLVAAAEGIVYFLASRKERAVLDRWAAYGGGSLEENFAALPRHKSNATALKVEEIAASMGMVKKDAGGTPTYPALPTELLDYHMAQSENPSGAVEPPPPAVAAMLAERAGALESLRQVLAAGPPPQWESDPDKLYAAPIPPLLLQINLTRLLAADALAAVVAGDSGRAMADAEAGWALTEPLLARPELISQYVAMANTRMWLAVLRKSPQVPEAWTGRLAALDPRKAFVRSLRFESLNSFYMGRRGGMELETVAVLQGGFTEALQAPLMRLMLFDAVLHTLNFVDALDRQPPCSGPYDAALQAVQEGIPRWNIIARIATPNLTDGWSRVERFRLDLELTDRVARLKAGRGADGAWPALPEGFEKSYCPKARWVATTEGGALAIALEGGPEFPKDVPWTRVPLRYEEAAPAPKK